MILGIAVAVVHNKYVNREFKGAMAPYGNSKLVFMIMIPVVAVLIYRNNLYLAKYS
jgi:PTS system arbutin-like IIC component